MCHAEGCSLRFSSVNFNLPHFRGITRFKLRASTKKKPGECWKVKTNESFMMGVERPSCDASAGMFRAVILSIINGSSFAKFFGGNGRRGDHQSFGACFSAELCKHLKRWCSTLLAERHSRCFLLRVFGL